MKIILNSFNCSHILDLHWKLIKTTTKNLLALTFRIYKWIIEVSLFQAPVILDALRNCVPGPLIGWGHVTGSEQLVVSNGDIPQF